MVWQVGQLTLVTFLFVGLLIECQAFVIAFVLIVLMILLQAVKGSEGSVGVAQKRLSVIPQ